GPAAPVTDPSTIARVVPLFALAKDHEHVLTANPAERRALQAGGWHLDTTATSNCDGIVGDVFDRPVTWAAPAGGTGSTVPLHRFRNKMTGAYRLGPAASARPGLADQGVVGHGFRDASRAEGTGAAVALHRRVDAKTGETYLSTDARPRAGFAD